MAKDINNRMKDGMGREEKRDRKKRKEQKERRKGGIGRKGKTPGKTPGVNY